MISSKDLRALGLHPNEAIYFYAVNRTGPAHEMALAGEPTKGYRVIMRDAETGERTVRDLGTDIEQVLNTWIEMATDVGYLPVAPSVAAA